MFRGRKLFRNIIICILGLLVVFSVSSFFIEDKDTQNFSFRFSFDSNIQYNFIRPVKNLKSLTLNANLGHVILRESNDDYVKVMTEISPDIQRKIPEYFMSACDNDEFIIEQKKINNFNPNPNDITIEIYVPQKYKKEIKINSKSGNIDGAANNDLKVKSDLGSINLTINCNKVYVNNSTGSISLSIKSSKREDSLKDISIKLKTSQGKITRYNEFKKLKFSDKNTINYKNGNCKRIVEAKSDLGSIEIK